MPRNGAVRQTAADAYFYDVEDYVEGVVERCNLLGIREQPGFGSLWPIPKQRQFVSINEAQVYADSVVASEFARRRWPEHTERVLVLARPATVDGAGREVRHGRAYHRQGRIYLPDHASSGAVRSRFMNELTVLHELAHWYGGNAHADRFREALLALVAERLDPMFAQWWRILLAAGLDHTGALN